MIPKKEEWINALNSRHGHRLQEKISSAAVAVCGLGGLGSKIAITLARMGVGKLVLIDYDRVDITNLNRQQYKASQIGMYKTEAMYENIKEISPYINIEKHTVRIDKSNAGELLGYANIICEAFDDAVCKAELANFVLESMPCKWLVAASGMAGIGSANAIRTRRISKRFYLCGDGVSDASDGIGLVSSRVMLCAAHQAHTVLRIIANEFEV